MAHLVMEEDVFDDDVPVPETYLPAFPRQRDISASLGMIGDRRAPLGLPHFMPWTDFVLDYPDEIWEKIVDEDKRYYYYIYYLDSDETPPAFTVEVAWIEDIWSVNNVALVTSQGNLTPLRQGLRVYSRVKELERETFVKRLNDQALMEYDQDRLDTARELIDSAITLSGTASAYLFNNRGLIHWKMGRTAFAKQDFLESIKLDPNNGDPYFNIGLIYFDESDYSHALDYLSHAVEINPSDSQFLTELGHLYLEMDEEDEALSLFGRAFENNPEDPQVDFHLGYYFLYKKRRPKDAVKHYYSGLKKDPHDQFALADLAVAHWVLGNRRKTLQLHRLLDDKPGLMPYTISRLVYLNMEMGNYETALNYYKEALAHSDPFEPEWLHYNAALVYAKTGHAKQALDILNLAVKAGGEAVIKRAISEKALEQVTRSADFKKLVKHGPKRRNR